ncbi:hypothetical protein BS636_10210 [Acinetobacter sp. LoGeW2-3]|uniref:phage tail-collar fiber domain-containing protein n=1 Tax=Acinetobacter sp. LoGeW2-3 TaxID=1808001 RepID=UPI000C057F13|nr:phage tail protein [Acinetobacter sp. LoGeW2-3]ATO20000.1 hypothetical protein BS636_10210 [Acinetobacter sp. LoGeW2-3]
MAEYYNVTTNLGDAEIANAIATNTKLDITHVAFGDGNGSVPTPNKARTSLVREVHRQAVTKYERHKTNANWIVIETIIPSNVGGFTIREMGVIANGKLISHGSHAPFEKVEDPSGVSEYRLKFTQNITDGSVVEIMLDESLIYASQAWVEENFIKRIDIIDNLTTNEPAKPVSAKQAKVLQDNKLDKNANAASASKLETSRQVSFSGAATGSFNFDGSTGTSCTLTLANSGVTAGTYGTTLKVPVITVNAKGLITTVTTQDIPSASTSVKGLVQLSNALNSTSTVQALTAAQGKKLQDEKLDKSGGTVTGGLNINIDADGGLSVNAGGTTQAQVRVSNSIHNGMLQASVGGNFGLYDTTFGKWIVHARSSGDVELNGNAASATNCSRSIAAGNGLSGGGELNANRTLTLGTPGTITASTGNAVSASSHTHDLNIDGFFQAAKSANGYQRFPGGLILQWGTANSDSTSGTVTMPIAFPNETLFGLVGETKSDTSGPTFNFAWVRGTTTKSTLGWQSTGNPGLFSWFAIGY